ncbi:MAG: cystathionine beta-lyase [Hyphomicrobiales bacterium]|nr:cystathionine beta-lyase [Hyphomicrobiales bacterium]
MTTARHARLDLTTKMMLGGRNPDEQFGFVNTPIYRGSTVLKPTVAALNDRHHARFIYGTMGSPTTEALEKAWTELAGAAGTVLVPSGLAAVTIAFMAFLKAGDHFLVPDSVYRPARNFCDTVLKRMGVETTYYDPLIGKDIARLMRPNTVAIHTEAPGSQSFEMQDIPAIAEVAHAHGAIVLMDNTWATPLLFPPHERGVDVAIEAGTKYLGGHSDVLLGMISANQRCWKRLRDTFTAFGCCPSPEDVWLGLRGLRTMELRLRTQEKKTLEMARWLQKRPEVLRVLHPALPDDPGHAIWTRDFKGSSSLFSIVLRPVPHKAVEAMLNGMSLFGLGFSWGGYESLAVPFDCSEYRTATQFDPGGPCIRLQIGLESNKDLKADLAAGFRRLAKATA